MKALVVAVFIASAASGFSQGILLKDGKHIVAKALKRQGDSIVATNPAEGGGKEMTGDVGYAIALIEKLEFPEPAQLRTVPDMITQGKTAEAVAQLDSALRYYEGFRDAPGSYWGELALLKGQALLSLGRVNDAEPLAASLLSGARDPEVIMGARAQAASCLTLKGEHAKAIEIFEQVSKDALRPDTLAGAAIFKGRSHLALKQWEPALLSFLTVPVFYPEAKALLPASMLGAGRAYFMLDDFDHAKNTLNDLIKIYANTPEAAEAKTELEKIARKEKALEGPGGPAPANPKPTAQTP